VFLAVSLEERGCRIRSVVAVQSDVRRQIRVDNIVINIQGNSELILTAVPSTGTRVGFAGDGSKTPSMTLCTAEGSTGTSERRRNNGESPPFLAASVGLREAGRRTPCARRRPLLLATFDPSDVRTPLEQAGELDEH
jgi:hypothetical protein